MQPEQANKLNSVRPTQATDKGKVCHCSVQLKKVGVKKGGNIILHDVSLTANHGEILALIGRNGAGKTTLLKAIMGRLPHTGAITFFNADGQPIRRPRIGYVPQSLAFDPSTPVTVADLFSANSSRLPVWLGHRKAQREKARQVLSKVGAAGLLDKTLGALSGGELQRVLLAFALEPMPEGMEISAIRLDETTARVAFLAPMPPGSSETSMNFYQLGTGHYRAPDGTVKYIGGHSTYVSDTLWRDTPYETPIPEGYFVEEYTIEHCYWDVISMGLHVSRRTAFDTPVTLALQ